MNKLLALALAGGLAFTSFSAAEAREGCGPGGHRGPYGHCQPNRGERVVVAPDRLIIGNYYRNHGYWDGRAYWPDRLVVGNYYRNRGYWDGRRYWRRHERWHDQWRYRD